MIELKQAIIVEGKYDKIKLDSIVDTVIIPTNGFGIYKDKEKMALIRAFAEKDGIIILTDSDSAGFQIRNHLKNSIKNGKIINIYIPDIFGKEKRKAQPSKQGKLGVEGISTDILLDAFKRAGISSNANVDNKKAIPFLTKSELLEQGFIGGENSAEKRKCLLRALSLPEMLNTNAMLDVINSLFSREEYDKAIEQIKEI